MFGPSGKLYQPPSFRLRLLERERASEEIGAEHAEEIAAAMERVNGEKRQPKRRRDQTAV